MEIADPNGALSWSNSVSSQALTVQCWFKLSIPSGLATENMTILINRRTAGNPHAYHIWYDAAKGSIEFSTWGTALWQRTLITRPYPDRWYHVAVVRDGATITAYVDGNVVPSVDGTPTNAGDARSTDGVSIGGWENGKYLYGEVQEVSIYQGVRGRTMIRDFMFRDQDTNDVKLVGYYKMGFAQQPAQRLSNLAAVPGTAGLSKGAGTISYEETDRAGEQSSFDARRNGGADAIAPLSGSFWWDQTALNRATPGIPLTFRIGYGSANPAGKFYSGDPDPSRAGPLENRWRHSFETRIIPMEYFGDSRSIGLLMWNGAIETWDKVGDTDQYQTRRKQYGGEFYDAGTNHIWVTPERLVYTFRARDTSQGAMRGRLISIADYNGNQVRLEYNESTGELTKIVDSAGGAWAFSYSGDNLLQSVSFEDWSVLFEYDAAKRLISKTLTNTSGAYAKVNTTLRFNYYTSGISSNLLQSIVDSRGNTNVIVFYDEYGRKTNTVNALGFATRCEYGVPNRRQITTTDAEGFKWIDTCDRNGQTIARRNPLGHETKYTFDQKGNRTSTMDPRGYLTLFSYDEHGNTEAQTNALGEVTRNVYDLALNRPLTVTDALGLVTTNRYDAKGNLIDRRDSLGTLASYTYAPNGLTRSETDPNGNTSRYGYNSDGFRIAETNAAGHARLSGYNNLGWVLAVTNALGEVTTYDYDFNGNVVATKDPLGRIYAGTFDANGNQLTQADPKGQQAQFTYDALNQKTSEVDRTGGTMRFTYTPRGAQASYTNVIGRFTLYQYDSAGRETNSVDALGNSVATLYDPNGNSVAIIDSTGQKWTKIFDALNRAVTVTDPSGNTTRTFFDKAGRVRETIGPDGFPTKYAYDTRGRMIRRTDPAGSVWHYGYDSVGNLTNVTDALGGHYAMAYGPVNERILERNQDGKEWHYTYDPLMRLSTRRQPNGTTETLEYDAGNRVLSVAFSTGRVNSFLYDDNDNPVVLSRSGSGPATITQVAYDPMDRVQQYTDAFSKTIKYHYDLAGRMTRLTYPDGKILTNRYDILDRLTNQVFQFSAQQAFTNSYAYDKVGRLIRRTYPNGIVQTNAFDKVGRVTSLSYESIKPQGIGFGYTYDRSGNTVGRTEKGTFQWPVPAAREERARYTPAANLIDREILTELPPALIKYSYDSCGNMTNAVGNGHLWSLKYDEDNRTAEMHWDSGLTAKTIINRFDAMGRRIAKTVNGEITGYVLDAAMGMERVLCDLDSTRTITAWYVHGPDLAFKITPAAGAATLTCYHADAQGNIIALTDAQANTVAEYSYTPYGRSLGSTGPAASQPYRFAGSQGVMKELPGLYFMRARYYSAFTGVFLSTDPVRTIGSSWLPIAFAYGECNPLRFNDPKGEIFNFIAAAFTAIGGAVVGFVVDVATQLIENKGDFGEINWGRAGIAAGIGFVQGAIAGVTMGASLVAQIIVGAVVGGVTAFVQTGLNNLVEGKSFVGSWQEVLFEVGMGTALGAIPGGGKSKPKVKIKTSKPPSLAPVLRRAKTAFEPPRIHKPNLTRMVSSPIVEQVAETPVKRGFGRAVAEGLVDGSKDFFGGVGAGLFGEKLAEWLQVTEPE